MILPLYLDYTTLFRVQTAQLQKRSEFIRVERGRRMSLLIRVVASGTDLDLAWNGDQLRR